MPDETPDPTDSDVPQRDDGGDSDAATSDRHTVTQDIVDEAERLTRLAGEAVDDQEAAAYRAKRTELLAEYDYTARVREDETRDVLVLHPDEWIDDGTVRPERVEDVDRGVEVPLSGPGEGDDWEAIDSHNRELVEAVRDEHGDTHAANAAALADFAGNHYAKPIESATAEELEEFLADYFLRNAWPTPDQRDVVEKSVRLVFDAADEPCPLE